MGLHGQKCFYEREESSVNLEYLHLFGISKLKSTEAAWLLGAGMPGLLESS
jgi:hypothetical protein